MEGDSGGGFLTGEVRDDITAAALTGGSLTSSMTPGKSVVM